MGKQNIKLQGTIHKPLGKDVSSPIKEENLKNTSFILEYPPLPEDRDNYTDMVFPLLMMKLRHSL